jgi:hypothetical protein
MPDLVSLTDLKTFLGVTASTDDDLLTDLLEHLEALFESETGRKDAPFTAAAEDRIETLDGTGSAHVFLDYPISALVSAILGFDPSDPVETLDTTDLEIMTFTAGHRRLTRSDGGTWGIVGAPNYVQITYDTQADLPEEAQLAIKRAVGQVYRQRGSEDATSETIGAYRRDLSNLIADDPLWTRAVAAHRRWVLA